MFFGKIKRNDFIAGMMIVVFSLVMLWGLRFTPDYKGVNLPAILWPRFLLRLFLVLGVILVITSVKSLFTRKGETAAVPRGTGEGGDVTRLALIILLSVSYLVLINYVGFALATPVFTYLFMWFLGEKNKKRNLLVAIIADILFIVIFAKIVGIPLPRGKSIFWELSLLLY